MWVLQLAPTASVIPGTNAAAHITQKTRPEIAGSSYATCDAFQSFPVLPIITDQSQSQKF